MTGKSTIVLLCLVAGIAGGCAKWYAQDADRETYRILRQKNEAALKRPRVFSIEPDPDLKRLFEEAAEKAQSPRAQGPAEAEAGPGAAAAAEVAAAPDAAAAPEAAPAPAGEAPSAADNLPPPLPESPEGAIHLTMADALRVAVCSSREYQAQKETAYLAALTLTFQRYLFRPIPTWTGSLDFSDDNAGADTSERRRAWDYASTVGVSQQLADGATIVGSIGLTALKYLNKELGDTVDSTLNFTVTQPLWRGAGRKIVQENLLQAERNAFYAVRTFARFEQTFAVSIASQYLGVLRQRDVVINEWRNYRSLIESRDRAEWLAKAEALPEFQVDQARQDELRAYNRWIVALASYENALDSLKITLGIPLVTEIALDPAELERLSAEGLQAIAINPEQAVAQAVRLRLDLANTRDGLEDADRKVVVAEDGLKGDVDLVASIGYQSLSDSPQSARLLFNRGNYAIGLDIDMPVDRLSERNALRTAQISREAAWRARTLLEDNVVLQVRQAVRALDQVRKTYENQKQSVALAERRVESTELLLQAGRATQRDVLEAKSALLDAQNGLVRALVDHTLAGLELQRDVGILVVDEKGQIHGWSLTDDGR